MANHTMRVIMRNFEAMLLEMPFNKVTVSALVERCEISSNTFYYHFRDIYELQGRSIYQSEQRQPRLGEVAEVCVESNANELQNDLPYLGSYIKRASGTICFWSCSGLVL